MLSENEQLIHQDLQHIWHPCAQMKDFEQTPPLIIHKAKGAYLKTNQGMLIDGIASWWCKSLGHGHPRVLAAIKEQMKRFEHVIATTTTHKVLAALGEKLAALSHKQHVFFASDGASAVEIALKLALHKSKMEGNTKRQEFVALTNGYHGETLGTLAVSDLGLYKKPYSGFGPRCHFITPPYISSCTDPLWFDASAIWAVLENKLNALKERLSAVIVEPIVQGAFGMQLYSADFLKKLYTWAKANNIMFIADEIMTGLYRTGPCFASEHARINPDIICLSKGLTSGTMPFSVALIDKKIYDLFYCDYDARTAFLHSHTYSGHALGAAAALATLKVMEEDNIEGQVRHLSAYMLKKFKQVADETKLLSNIRSIGAIVAADLPPLLKKEPRLSLAFYQKAVTHGALLRPIGKNLYWLPPLNTDEKTIDKLAKATMNTLYDLYL